jgi:hypothetical protein
VISKYEDRYVASPLVSAYVHHSFLQLDGCRKACVRSPIFLVFLGIRELIVRNSDILTELIYLDELVAQGVFDSASYLTESAEHAPSTIQPQDLFDMATRYPLFDTNFLGHDIRVTEDDPFAMLFE